MVEGVYRRNYPKPESDKAALRATLVELKADIVLLQEMGDERFLLELQRDLKGEGLNYAYSHVHEAADEHRHLAVLSHLPFEVLNAERVLDFKYRGELTAVKRGLLELGLKSEGQPWRLFNLHLKSRYTDFEDDPESLERRTAEARVIRQAVRKELEAQPEAVFFVAGDFNDHPASRPLQRFREIGDRPFLRLLPLVDSRGDAWTHHYKRFDSYTRVDMVLASPHAWELIEMDQSYVYDAPIIREASDHRPLVWVVDFSQ